MADARTEAVNVIEDLAREYPLLYLNPDADTQDAYRRVVLGGDDPGKRDLSHYAGDASDRDEEIDTPAGAVRVVTLGNRRDFELVVRGFMAAKYGPLDRVPESQGAATLTTFNWARIKDHLSRFPETEQQAEFERFTAVKENYVDTLVVLSRGPYSHVAADAVGLPEGEWLGYSDVIRRYHELTHVVCRRLYPGDVDAVRDELIADAVGLHAAFGRFDPELEELFLGVRDGQYVGGRLENYTDDPCGEAGRVVEMLDGIREAIDGHPRSDPFELIPVLMR